MFTLKELNEMHDCCAQMKSLCVLSDNKNEFERIIHNFDQKILSIINILKEQEEDLKLSFSDKVY